MHTMQCERRVYCYIGSTEEGGLKMILNTWRLVLLWWNISQSPCHLQRSDAAPSSQMPGWSPHHRPPGSSHRPGSAQEVGLDCGPEVFSTSCFRFEYKYSFKPPYLAQKDGSVPFFEYSGEKYGFDLVIWELSPLKFVWSSCPVERCLSFRECHRFWRKRQSYSKS